MYVQLCLREQSQFHPSRITSKIGINDGRGQKCPYSNQSLSAIIKIDKNIKALFMHQLCSVFLRSSQSLFFNIYTLIWRFMNVNSHRLQLPLLIKVHNIDKPCAHYTFEFQLISFTVEIFF